MRHPDERKIALYACGDASWMERLSTSRHMSNCAECRALARQFREDRETIRRQAAELPQGVDWNRLAAEMTANIHVGLEAGECVSAAPLRRPRPLSWRPVFVAAGLTAVLFAALFLNFPAEQRLSLTNGIQRLLNRSVSLDDVGVALATTRNGIEVRENGSTLTMVNLGAAPSVVVVNTSGSLRARYVDDDTGQVTITNVYAQQ